MLSLDQILDGMLMEHFRNVQPINQTGAPAFQITYQFESSAPADDWSGTTGWSALSAAEQDNVREALAHVETFLNVDFVELTGAADADLSFGQVDLPGSTAGLGGAALAYTGNGVVTDYDAFAVWDNMVDITSGFNLILHELGHALGLDHPFEHTPVPEQYQNNHYTVMAYQSDPISGVSNDAMMLLDVFALQWVWGAAEFNTGNTVYTGPRTGNVDVVWDTGGTDTFSVAGTSGNAILDLRQGHFSTFGTYEDVAIAAGVTIENATGGHGNDRLTGNGAANTLQGNAGADTLQGNAGADLLDGGNGNDTLYGNAGNDTLHGGGGNDLLKGGRANDTLYGGNGWDTLCGDRGKDTLNGGNGADKLWGGGFHDILRGGNGQDTLGGGRGNDTLRGGAGFDYLYGGKGADTLYGGTEDDILKGGRGRDVLDGGRGDDTLWGGIGNDTFNFRSNGGADRLRDFQDNADRLVIEGFGTRDQLLAAAADVDGNVVFDFGGGNMITVENMTLAALENDVFAA